MQTTQIDWIWRRVATLLAVVIVTLYLIYASTGVAIHGYVLAFAALILAVVNLSALLWQEQEMSSENTDFQLPEASVAES